GRDTLYDVVRRTAEQCFMPLTVGGGVRTVEDIRKLLLAGSDKVSINTAAVAHPEFVREAAEKFGSQCIVAAIDAKAVAPGKWEVFTHGGRRPTGIDAVEWACRLTGYGAGRSEEHTSELQSLAYLVCRLLLEKNTTLFHDNVPLGFFGA